MSERQPLRVAIRPRSIRNRHFHRGFLAGIGAGFGAGALICALELLGYARGAFELLAVLLLAGTGLALVCALVAALSPAFRSSAIPFVLVSLLALPSFLLTLPAQEFFREIAFERLAKRAEPLVAAIRAYENRYHLVPPDLLALVPEFLDEIPGTGMPNCPSFQYRAGRPTPDSLICWSLEVECSRGHVNWDRFVYSPNNAGFDPSVDPVTASAIGSTGTSDALDMRPEFESRVRLDLWLSLSCFPSAICRASVARTPSACRRTRAPS